MKGPLTSPAVELWAMASATLCLPDFWEAMMGEGICQPPPLLLQFGVSVRSTEYEDATVNHHVVIVIDSRGTEYNSL